MLRNLLTRLLAVLACVVVALGSSVITAAAQAPDNPYVLDDEQTQGPTGNGDVDVDVEVLGSQTTRPSGGALPLTGAEIATLAACGLGLVVVGGAFVRGSRRSSEA